MRLSLLCSICALVGLAGCSHYHDEYCYDEPVIVSRPVHVAPECYEDRYCPIDERPVYRERRVIERRYRYYDGY
jgi:hypothetical protein